MLYNFIQSWWIINYWSIIDWEERCELFFDFKQDSGITKILNCWQFSIYVIEIISAADDMEDKTPIDPCSRKYLYSFQL